MGWRDEQPKFVAGPKGRTAGLTRGTVTALTKENYRLRSDERDRDAPDGPLSGPTTGTHIIYQMGSGVEEVGECTNPSRDNLVPRASPRLVTVGVPPSMAGASWIQRGSLHTARASRGAYPLSHGNGSNETIAANLNLRDDGSWLELPCGERQQAFALVGDEGPDEWDLPPKPKGMRWTTYEK